MPSAVRDDRNGKTFDPNDIQGMIDYIERNLADPVSYPQLALSSFREYQSCLNWETVGESRKKLLSQIAAQAPELQQ